MVAMWGMWQRLLNNSEFLFLEDPTWGISIWIYMYLILQPATSLNNGGSDFKYYGSEGFVSWFAVSGSFMKYTSTLLCDHNFFGSVSSLDVWSHSLCVILIVTRPIMAEHCLYRVGRVSIFL